MLHEPISTMSVPPLSLLCCHRNHASLHQPDLWQSSEVTWVTMTAYMIFDHTTHNSLVKGHKDSLPQNSRQLNASSIRLKSGEYGGRKMSRQPAIHTSQSLAGSDNLYHSPAASTASHTTLLLCMRQLSMMRMLLGPGYGFIFGN